jgi:hypothetical protein
MASLRINNDLRGRNNPFAQRKNPEITSKILKTAKLRLKATMLICANGVLLANAPKTLKLMAQLWAASVLFFNYTVTLITGKFKVCKLLAECANFM